MYPAAECECIIGTVPVVVSDHQHKHFVLETISCCQTTSTNISCQTTSTNQRPKLPPILHLYGDTPTHRYHRSCTFKGTPTPPLTGTTDPVFSTARAETADVAWLIVMISTPMRITASSRTTPRPATNASIPANTQRPDWLPGDVTPPTARISRKGDGNVGQNVFLSLLLQEVSPLSEMFP